MTKTHPKADNIHPKINDALVQTFQPLRVVKLDTKLQASDPGSSSCLQNPSLPQLPASVAQGFSWDVGSWRRALPFGSTAWMEPG